MWAMKTNPAENFSWNTGCLIGILMSRFIMNSSHNCLVCHPVIPYKPSTTTSWWFQLSWKILVKMGIFPKFRGENKTCLKPTPIDQSFSCDSYWFFLNLENFTSTESSDMDLQPPRWRSTRWTWKKGTADRGAKAQIPNEGGTSRWWFFTNPPWKRCSSKWESCPNRGDKKTFETTT